MTPKDVKWLKTCDFAAMQFSTCSKRQYASFVLDRFGRVLGMGYNGSPPGYGHCNQGACPRAALDSAPGTSYDNCISVHAEENALLFSDHAARHGGTLYVNGTPCYGCAKKIAGSGVARFVGIADPRYADGDRGLDLLRACGLEVVMAPIVLEDACV